MHAVSTEEGMTLGEEALFTWGVIPEEGCQPATLSAIGDLQ